MTAVANAAFTAAQFNTHVRDNLLETMPAKATTDGQYAVATGANAIAMRKASSALASPVQTTSSTTYTSASGPSVTVTTGQTALVIASAALTIDTNSESAFYSVDVSGATTITANDNRALSVGRYTSAFLIAASHVTLFTALTPGSNTFAGHVRVTNAAATASYNDRRIVVVPF